MRTTRRLTSGVITLLIVFMTIVAAPLIGPERAYACSCAQVPDMESAMSKNSAVFAGEVTKIDKGGVFQKIQSSADKVEVVFNVEKVWKGELSAETTVWTVRSEASCGFTFSDNMSYLVFANEDEAGDLHTGLCSGNLSLSGASDEMEQLDAINPAYEPAAKKLRTDAAAAPGDAQLAAEPNADGSDSAVYGMAAIAALLVLAAIVLMMARGRRRR